MENGFVYSIFCFLRQRMNNRPKHEDILVSMRVVVGQL